MSQPCLELVTYTVHNAADGDAARADAAGHADALPGFAGWLPLSAAADATQRADLVVWSSVQAAQDAARTVGSAPQFGAFRTSIAAVGAMSHFPLPAGGQPWMLPGDGVELGRFRLREGVSEAALAEAHGRMVTRHLARQPGWRGQRLLRLGDGEWLDLAFADSAQAARAICASWTDSSDCAAFLAMIEPVSMTFGEVAAPPPATPG